MRHRINIAKLEKFIALGVEFVCVRTGICKDCDHGIFTRIAVMQHLYQLCIPICLSYVATFDLKLIGLTFVVALDHMAGMEIAGCLFM